MLEGYTSTRETSFTVECHDRVFNLVTTALDTPPNEPLFRAESKLGTSWSWRRKVYDQSSSADEGEGGAAAQKHIFDFRHASIDPKNRWLVESVDDKRQLAELVHKKQVTSVGHSDIDATVRTTAGEDVLIPLYHYLYISLLPSIFYETLFRLDVPDVTETTLLRRLGDVTTREVIVRSYTAVVWIWESLVMLDGANAVLAILAVLSGMDKPGDWPNLFGSPIAACGLRNFWSQFWHRLAVRSYGNFGRIVARYIPMGSKYTRKSVVAFVVFLLSGLSHSAVSWRLGHVDWDVDLQWFMLNFAACSMELVVVSTVRDVARRLGLAREMKLLETSWLGYLIGYSWVFGFFFWTVPMWRFPRLHRQLDATDRLMRLLSKMTLIPKEE
ncbi:membrane bound O-acyl transferase family-domain-containing protein [Diaporthe sp. PMI_573]|nr:membrane bound O-acyl transferase family-domain-containing protein [Diaporthaceae sp. PMI_573]